MFSYDNTFVLLRPDCRDTGLEPDKPQFGSDGAWVIVTEKAAWSHTHLWRIPDMADRQVLVYSTPTCPWCRKAKEYLDQKGVRYENYNVAEQRDKLQEMVDLSGQRGVPVLKIGDEVIVGFNQAKIDQALAG
jgi:glutaredoxin-like YruB-family protein